MDFNVKYDGPKPLDPLTGEKHNCKEENVTSEEEEVRGSYSYLLAYFLHHGYPSLGKHYTRAYYRGTGLQQPCGDIRCECARAEKYRWEHPLEASEWNKERAEWLKQWNQPIEHERFRTCWRCSKYFKTFSYNNNDELCSACYWEIEMEQGIPYTPFGFDRHDE